MASAKDCHVMTTFYLTEYDEKYGRKPLVNRHKARWGFDSVLQDMTMKEAKELILYYLDTHSDHGHSLEWFFYNYDKLVDKKNEFEKDEADRRRLRAESKRRVEEWRKRQLDNNSG